MIPVLLQGAVDTGQTQAAALIQHPPDSIVVTSPLPGGVAAVFRWLFNAVPQWVQIGGAIVAGLMGLAVAWWIFSHRVAIWTWFTSQTNMMRATIATAIVAMLLGAGVAGAATWNYTQHSNDFCTGCHVMNPAYQKFTSGSNKHGKLSCHDCHQQSTLDSMRQLYQWVAERPDKIEAHSPVPNSVCMTCHVTGDTASWQRVKATAGHRVHFESDSAPLKDLLCVTCHGAEVHRFRPVSETCGQSNCHKPKDTEVVLGKMANQTVRHCTSCHEFTTEVPALATTDSARGSLVPGRQQCMGCHEMRKALAEFDEGKDPHGGKCGTCHNPHTQKLPSDAKNSCASAGCHDNYKDVPFHTGFNHRKVGTSCTTCHVPHAAKVDASGCQECHTKVRAQGNRRPPLPFDTTQALRRMNAPPAARPPDEPDAASESEPSMDDGEFVATVRGEPVASVLDEAPPPPVPITQRMQPQRATADSFPHSRHTKFACLACHRTGQLHGGLTFERPRGCAICHHQDASPAKCATCHKPAKYDAPITATMSVTVPGRAPKPRSVGFLHSQHASKTCVECHTTPVTLAAAPAKASCNDCHSDHHAESSTCTACHRIADPKAEHKPTEVTHQQCDACHTRTVIAGLTPTRSLCSSCHTAKATAHYDNKECSTCHFLAAPNVYRAKLTRPPAR